MQRSDISAWTKELVDATVKITMVEPHREDGSGVHKGYKAGYVLLGR